MTTPFKNFPICVFSFNRPEVLARTLESLQQALDVANMHGPVVLFQDGAYNEFSRQEKASPEIVNECETIFRDLIPQGVVKASPVNLGIGKNIYRGEKWVFEDMAFHGGVFFEDDMVVSPRYFCVMAKLYEQVVLQPRVAMFSAYGADALRPIEDQIRDLRQIDRMHHNWCFCLMRNAWLAREKYTAEYMRLIENCDYRDRPLYKIAAWYSKMGWPPMPTNQDRAKTVVFNTLGLARITSKAICARNIGETGQHYEPAEFRSLGFDRAVMLEEYHPDMEWDFDPVTDSTIDAIIREERVKLVEFRLGIEPFSAEPEIMDAVRILKKVRGETLLQSTAHALIDMVTGLYEDGWTSDRMMIVFRPSAALRSIEIVGKAAPHLTAGTEFRFKLNDQDVSSINVAADETFKVTIQTPAHLDGLEKIVTSRCSVAMDLFSAGYSPDRRPLGFNVHSVTIVDSNGMHSVKSGEILAWDFVVRPLT